MADSLVSNADHEQARLEALRRYAVVDTAAEREFDDLVRRAAQECGYQTALLSFMEADRCYFKAQTGLLPQCGIGREVPRNQTFCNYALGSSGVFVVRDAREDERFRPHAADAQLGGYRSYAGAQLITPEG